MLLRQQPAWATGVIFITLEDETGIAYLIVWSSLFERQRRVVAAASMMARSGRVQREGDVIHILAENLEDLSGLPGTIGDREEGLSAPHE